jgi:hypothetical protein
MLHRLTLLLGAGAALGAAACDDEPLDLAPFTIDTRDPDGADRGALVAFEGEGGWQAAATTAPGVFTFTPTGEAVTYAVVCPALATEPRAGTRVSIVYSGLVEERAVSIGCQFTESEPGRAGVTVAVTPADASVSIGRSSDYGWAGNTERTLPIEPGTYDVVAGTKDKVLVRRGVAFPTPAPILFDVEAEGVARTPVPITPPATDDGETLYLSYAFRTAGGTAAYLPDDGTTDALRVVPAALATAGDVHESSLWAASPERERWFWKRGTVEEVTTDLELPASLTASSATWNGVPEIRWQGEVDGDNLGAYIDQYSGVNVHWSGWWDAAGRAASDPGGRWSPPDLSAVAGWNPAWNLDRIAIASTDWAVSVDGWIGDGETSYGASTLLGTFSPTGRNAASSAGALRPGRPATRVAQ